MAFVNSVRLCALSPSQLFLIRANTLSAFSASSSQEVTFEGFDMLLLVADDVELTAVVAGAAAVAGIIGFVRTGTTGLLLVGATAVLFVEPGVLADEGDADDDAILLSFSALLSDEGVLLTSPLPLLILLLPFTTTTGTTCDVVVGLLLLFPV